MLFNRHTLSMRNAAGAGLLLLALLFPAWQLDAAPAKGAKGAKAAAKAGTTAPVERKSEISPQAAEEVAKIVGFLRQEPAPNLDEAFNAINELIPKVDPESYDMAWLSKQKGQILLMKAHAGDGNYTPAIGPFETVLRLSEKYNYFDKKTELEMIWALTQLYAQEGNMEKNPAIQKQKYAKALASMRRWLSLTPQAIFDAYYFMAVILYQQAVADKEGQGVDKELLRQSEEAARNALLLAVKPRDIENTYQLLVGIGQNRNDPVMMARYLEILLQNNPKNASWWDALFASYHAGIEATPEESFLRNQAYAMAVYTIRRGQKHGFMMTPQHYYNLVAMYRLSGQHEAVVDILGEALRSGKLDPNDKQKWELLADSYLQLGQMRSAIAVYKEAAQRFPTDGNIDMQIGSLYLNIPQHAPALEFFLSATMKEVPEKKALILWNTIAYVYLYMKEYEKGMEAIAKALEINPNSQEAQNIKRGLTEAIAERERMRTIDMIINRSQQSPQGQPDQQPATTQPAP